MLALVARRSLAAVPSLIGVIVITFLLTRVVPGDPAAYFAGLAATEEAIAEIRAQLGLDKPLWEQFAIYIADLLTGDLGNSITTGQTVVDDIAQRLPASLELVVVALVFAIGVALPLGIAAAVYQGSWIDHLCRIVATAGVSLPTFFTGLVLTYIFYFLLRWAPAPQGRLDLFAFPPEEVTGFLLIDTLIAGDLATFQSAAAQLVLPAITMGLFVLAPIARMARASMLGVLSSDFVRTARALGLPGGKVLYVYAFRNALIPIITTLGMVFSFMLGAAVLVEQVFSWPGIGTYALRALVASDYAPVQGFVLVMATLYVLLNLVIDILYLLVDPRVRVDA